MWGARNKWFNIGVQFKIVVYDLEVIEKESDIDTKFNKVIIRWLNGGDNCTWRMICDVLKHSTINMKELAERIGMFVL